MPTLFSFIRSLCFVYRAHHHDLRLKLSSSPPNFAPLAYVLLKGSELERETILALNPHDAHLFAVDRAMTRDVALSSFLASVSLSSTTLLMLPSDFRNAHNM